MPARKSSTKKKGRKAKKHDTMMDRTLRTVGAGLRFVLTFIVTVGMLAFTSSAGEVMAYYTDTEVSANNILEATSLDFVLDTGEWSPHQNVSNLEPGETISRTVRLLDEVPEGSIPFQYMIKTQDVLGDDAFCSALTLEVMKGDLIIYTGPIDGFSSGPHLFPYQNLWTFSLSLPEFAEEFVEQDCGFNIAVEGWQETLPVFPEGFHDEERTINAVQSYVRECTIVDFETDAGGSPILLGQVIDDEYAPWGLNIFAENNDPEQPDTAIIFDSGTPTSGDTHLGTPNKDFSGPGVGAGGASGEPGENGTPQENVLIIPENDTDLGDDGYVDNPHGETAGGVITFEFDEPTWVNTLRLLDIDDDGSEITLFMNDDDDDTAVIPALNLGQNSIQRIDLNTSNVHKIEIAITGSAAVDDMCFETIQGVIENVHDVSQSFATQGGDEKARDYPHIKLNEIFANPVGPDGEDGLDGEWIEIYNSGPEEVNLNEWYIEDDSESGNRQTITAGNTHTGSTQIGAVGGDPDEWLVVFMHGEVLDNDADTVTLYTNTGRMIDSYSYDAGESGVPEGKSDARIPDGAGDWVDPIPTPGGPNMPDNGGEVLGTSSPSTQTPSEAESENEESSEEGIHNDDDTGDSSEDKRGDDDSTTPVVQNEESNQGESGVDEDEASQEETVQNDENHEDDSRAGDDQENQSDEDDQGENEGEGNTQDADQDEDYSDDSEGDNEDKEKQQVPNDQGDEGSDTQSSDDSEADGGNDELLNREDDQGVQDDSDAQE